MLLAITGDWTTKFETMNEKLFLALTIMLVGFLIVLFILTVIIFCIKLMSTSINFSSRFNKKKKIDTNLVSSQEEELTKDAKAITDTQSSEISDDELIAVISAAVAAFTSTSVRSAPYPGFKVRKIKTTS